MTTGEAQMQRFTLRAAALGVALAIGIAGTAIADVKDYEFRLLTQEVKKGEATIGVKLVHKPSGRAIPDAVIFAKRMDMAPDGMAMMDTPLEPIPPTKPGIYQFKTELTMEGNWQLSLGAKVQGESGTVENKLILKAIK
jgi:hypothetical protein